MILNDHFFPPLKIKAVFFCGTTKNKLSLGSLLGVMNHDELCPLKVEPPETCFTRTQYLHAAVDCYAN